MRTIQFMNNEWKYWKDYSDEYTTIDFNDSEWEPVMLPHANQELPFNGFDEKMYQFVSCYRRSLDITEEMSGKKLFLDFEGVMTAATVWVNGQEAGEHLGGYTPFSVDITDLVNVGESNVIAVKVDSTERNDIPPFGKVIDYLCYGGIYREVSLRVVEKTFIQNVFARPGKVLEEKKELAGTIFVQNATDQSKTIRVCMTLSKEDKTYGTCEKNLVLEPGNKEVELCCSELSDIQLWSLDQPDLYDVTVNLFVEDKEIDCYTTRVGFREAFFKPEGFFLNGERLQIIGLNRHQSFPYVGYAMPARAQRRDAEILKNELGLNLVRTSHYPQSRHFLDRCDELGLLVFEELPGWQHIGDDVWKSNACVALKEMIRNDWNHPSIILWGVRINESDDDHEFYIRTNKLARELDNTRQTGGVRCFEGSELLEDVYTMNDFIHEGEKAVLRSRKRVTKLNKQVPYLVTECNGHMHPTKRYDQEERLVEHALRHLRILHQAEKDPEISGSIQWCAFDYNTHKEFGSGDKICYHGITDMFRIPKYAASVYSSQIDPKLKAVLEPASLMAQGERNAARILPIHIFTNCDSVKLYKNGTLLDTFYPDKSTYPLLKHPPIVIRDLVGNQLEGMQFSKKDQKTIRELIGFIMAYGEEKLTLKQRFKIFILLKRYKMTVAEGLTLFMNFMTGWGDEEQLYEFAGFVDGKEVARKSYGTARADRLLISADDTELDSGDWDTTRVVLRLVDQHENVLPFVNDYIDWEVTGPASIIGPEKTTLIGGVLGAWIKTTGEPGEIEIKARCSRFESETIQIKVI